MVNAIDPAACFAAFAAFDDDAGSVVGSGLYSDIVTHFENAVALPLCPLLLLLSVFVCLFDISIKWAIEVTQYAIDRIWA